MMFCTGRIVVAAIATLTVCAALVLLPRLLEAGGAVTDCSNQVDLEAKLAGGGLVKFSCGPATIPITSTLVITQPTTIDGGGVITLDGLNERRIIDASAPFTLVNLTLWRGRVTGIGQNGGAVHSSSAVTLDRVTVLSNTADNRGGGLYAGSAVITASTFQSNTAYSGGGGLAAGSAVATASTFLSNTAYSGGGGLYAESSAVITGSTFQNNTAYYGGGGGLNAYSAVVTASTFQSNSASDSGGGLNAYSAVATASTFLSNSAYSGGGGLYAESSAVITASTFQNNTAYYGGGGGLLADSAVVTASTFQSNSASDSGGGLNAWTSAVVTASTFTSNAAGDDGGGLYAGSAVITASTFLSNSASSHGGAVRANGPLTLTNSTLHANTAITGSAIVNESATQPTRLAFSTLTANSSRVIATTGGGRILANSIVSGASPVCTGTATGTNEGVNFVSDTTCGTATQVDPLLGPLADNGGPTLTRALLVGSPAIGLVAVADCPTTDQRGVSRPVGDACDVGAYEYRAAPTLTALQPASALQGSPDFTLVVTGTHFLSGTVALWNGSVRPTTVLNSTTLSVAIPAGDLSMAGTMTVTARYGQAADSVSNGLPFSVLTPTPTPTLTPTPTPTLTPTPTPTLTPTPTPTNTPTPPTPGTGTRLLLPLISLNQPAG
jgi:predicted outer membrane repeat protein